MRRTLASLAAVIAVIAATSLLAAASAAAKPAAVATGSGGAIASESAPATQAGLAVLRKGGTAADAAVAVASTLGVSDPLVAGIGGGGYLVYYDAKTHSVYTIDGRETAPAAATPALFIDPATHKPLAFPHGRHQRAVGRGAGHADDLADGGQPLGALLAGQRPTARRARRPGGLRA